MSAACISFTGLQTAPDDAGNVIWVSKNGSDRLETSPQGTQTRIPEWSTYVYCTSPLRPIGCKEGRRLALVTISSKLAPGAQIVKQRRQYGIGSPKLPIPTSRISSLS